MYVTIALPEHQTKEQRLAHRIRVARINAELSQRELGKAIGLSRQGVGYIEATGNVSSVMLFDIAEATGQPLDFFKS